MSNNADVNIPLGLNHSEQLVIAIRHTVPEVDAEWSGFKEMPPVFATAMMIGFIEQTCVIALNQFLSPEQRTLGTHVDVSHIAPTPIGMTVTAHIELIEQNGRELVFKVRCVDQAGTIGEGTHRRTVINGERFMQKLNEKAKTTIISSP